ncbi:hypothetical protein HA44_19215 [Mixta gaviniae]|nr:hypothetical protein HA44_19215 [Mixta gaviniae]
MGEQRAGGADLAELGVIALSDRGDKHRLGMAVNIIQHPGGAPQQVALRDNFLLARGAAESEAANVLHYTADTDEGSSGAPVFNDQWQLVALHHGAAQDESGTPVNEGIRVSALVDWLKGEAIHLDATAQQRLIAALRGESIATLTASRAAPDANYANRNGYQPIYRRAGGFAGADYRAPGGGDRAAALGRYRHRSDTRLPEFFAGGLRRAAYRLSYRHQYRWRTLYQYQSRQRPAVAAAGRRQLVRR